MSPIEYLAPDPPRGPRHPWEPFGCIPVPWWTVNVGTVWLCEFCNTRMVRVDSSQHEGRAWVKVDDEFRDGKELTERPSRRGEGQS